MRGQPETVDSLRSMLKAPSRQHTYFFLGPGGTGKTSIARILADKFKCELIEVDAASNSGVDEVRALTATMGYAGFGERSGRAYLIDECQRLSPNAWDALLKSTEEPPEHVFFFFCSTDPRKIPAAILTRGPSFHLRSLSFDDLMDALEAVCVAEKLDTPDWALQAAARACGGSMRLALVMLAQVQDCRTEDEALQLLEGIGQHPEVIDLCRLILSPKGTTWAEVIKLLRPIKEKGTLGAEGIRIQVTLYAAAALMGATGRQVQFLLNVLAAFSKPCNSTDGMAPILLAFADVVDLNTTGERR